MVKNKVNSPGGVVISDDIVYGYPCCNMTRPAVLRQYFGSTVGLDVGQIYSYGSGSGKETAGTSVTRNMPPIMNAVGGWIFDKLSLLQQTNNDIMRGMKLVQPNHCTVLFYFQKNKKKNTRQLSFHCDQLYTNSGEFLTSKRNSQMESTPDHCRIVIHQQWWKPDCGLGG